MNVSKLIVSSILFLSCASAFAHSQAPAGRTTINHHYQVIIMAPPPPVVIVPGIVIAHLGSPFYYHGHGHGHGHHHHHHHGHHGHR